MNALNYSNFSTFPYSTKRYLKDIQHQMPNMYSTQYSAPIAKFQI